MSAATMNEIDRLRRERDEARAERDALAAHAGSLREAGAELADLMDGVREGDYTPDSFTNQPMRTALSETPTTSLARLIAEKQAEALEAVFLELEPISYRSASIMASKAAELRRRVQESAE